MEGHELKEQLVSIQINPEDKNNLDQLIDPEMDTVKPGIFSALGSVPVFTNPSVPKGKIHFIYEYVWIPTAEWLNNKMRFAPVFDIATGNIISMDPVA